MRKALILSAIFFLIVLFSCKKEGKLVPDFDTGNLAIHYVDTFAIKTSLDTVLPLVTDASIYHLLGLYNDPIFGPVSSSIYSQVLLTGLNVDFGGTVSNPNILDSLVLNLSYAGLYGNPSSPMTVEVYQLNAVLDKDKIYHSDTIIPHKDALLATKTFVPNTSAGLRIKLPNSLGNAILTNDPYADNLAFTSLLNGLYITVKESVTSTTIPQKSGSIAYFNMNTTATKVTLYYHELYKKSQQNELGNGVQKQYDFIISEAEKFSHFEHNYLGTDIEAHLNNLPTRDSTLTYVSTMAGVTTILSFPNIKDLAKQGAVIINKAELVLTIEPSIEDGYEEPLSSLSLAGRDVNGESFFLPDFLEGPEHFGGTWDEATDTYTFNITRHIHNLIHSTSPDYGMYLLATGSSISANRVVLGSENHPIRKIQLKITYSIF